MSMTHWFKATGLAVLVLGVTATQTGCKQNLAYQRSLSELNQKAQVMLQSGDFDGAIARLESAHDLQPDEPMTMFNLGVAYQAKGDFTKSIGMLTQLLDKPNVNRPDVLKALAISYEAKGDALSAQADAAESDLKKPDAEKLARARYESVQSYNMAIDYYRQALAGAKDGAEIQKQIDALQDRLKPKADSASTQALPE